MVVVAMMVPVLERKGVNEVDLLPHLLRRRLLLKSSTPPLHLPRLLVRMGHGVGNVETLVGAYKGLGLMQRRWSQMIQSLGIL